MIPVNPETSFVWGAGGAPMTPEQIAIQRKVAQAMMERGMDYSPIQSPWQGAARVAQGLLGGLEGAEADAATKKNADADRELIQQLLSGGTPSAATSNVAPVASAPMGETAAEGAASSAKSYGANTVTTDNGDTIALPPRNPLGNASPEYRTKFADLRSAAADQGVTFDAPEAGSIGNVRTPGQQAALYAQGRTAPGPVVTGTLNSNHLTGNALDVVPTGGTSPNAVGKVVTALTQNDPRFADMRSGATFKNLYDPLHVEMPGGTKVAANDEAAIPPNATPTQSVAPQSASAARGPLAGVDPRALAVIASPYASPAAKSIANLIIQQQTKDQNPTNDIKEYQLAVRQGFKGSLLDYQVKLKEAGKPVTTIDQRQESSFQVKAAEHAAKRYSDVVDDVPQAKQMLSDVQTLTDLGKIIGTGKEAQVKAALGPYAEALGIKVENLGEIQAFDAIVQRVAPSLRVKGSGAQSDFELKNFLKSLPSLGNMPKGNDMAARVMQGLYQNKLKAAEISSAALNGEMSRKDADKALRELPDPMQEWRDFNKKKKETKEVPIDDLVRKHGGMK